VNIKKLVTPYGQTINIGDLFIGVGKYGYVTKKGWDKSLNCYFFEIRWSTTTNQLIAKVDIVEIVSKLITNEWKHYSAYPSFRMKHVNTFF